MPGACWSPGYTLWLEQGRARLALRALVAQRTGEDWKGARLVLSTAEPDRFVQLPELARLRIGRAQMPKARRGWREPPDGADLLFADYDRAFGFPESPEPGERRMQEQAAPVGMLIEEALSAVPPPSPPGFGGMIPLAAQMMMPMAGAAPMSATDQPAMPMPSPAARPAAPPAMPSPARAKEKRRAAAEHGQLVASAAPQAVRYVAPPPPAPELDPERMSYRRLRLLDPDTTGRGELRSIDSSEAYSDVPAIGSQVDRAISAAKKRASISTSLPSGYQLAEPAGVFDDTYKVSLPADIPSDGAFHSIDHHRDGPDFPVK